MTIITVSADVAAHAAESLLQARAETLVQREVQLCLSSMVATLAGNYYGDRATNDLLSLQEQASELCCGRLDYEEGAAQEGWRIEGGMFVHHNLHTVAETSPDEDDAWEMLCREQGLEAYEWEVFEHWAVSTWLAEKLQEAGERVDTDFAGLNVWARTTTGQAISMDGVIRKITAELHADAPAA